jgi:hypothetical protein
MKKIIAFFIIGLASLFTTMARAQIITHADSVRAAGYFFTDFEDGSVLMKSGSIEKAPLNYNTNNQQIGFMKNGKYLELTGLETIDTIYIAERKFVPKREKFFMVVSTSTGMPLLALIYNKPASRTAAVDHYNLDKKNYGSVVNFESQNYAGRRFRRNFEMAYQKKFFLQNGKVLLKANNLEQLIDIYPEKKEQIRSYVKENKTNFEEENDLVALLVAIQ